MMKNGALCVPMNARGFSIVGEKNSKHYIESKLQFFNIKSLCCYFIRIVFSTSYRYENEKKYVRQVDARALWFAILESQIETGTPYMLYKDACNRKSNQQNLGTIKCSNLCTEIVEYSAPDEVH